MDNDKADTIQREYEQLQRRMPPKEVGEEPTATATATETQDDTLVLEDVSLKEEIMVPKWRLDEVITQLKDAKNPKTEIQTEVKQEQDVSRLVDEKLAPLRVQIEVNQVLADHKDFSEFASGAITRIKNNPALTLEDAYRLEKFDHLQSKAKEEGKNEALETIEKKQALDVEQSGRKTTQRPLDELVKDKTVPLEELAKMLPHS